LQFSSLKLSSLGLMQGRLLPQSSLGYQAFPWGAWQEEFQLAADRGLGYLEWVLDLHDIPYNPILAETQRVEQVARKSGIAIRSLCADFVMEHEPFNYSFVIDIFQRLAPKLKVLGVTYVVLPFVDAKSLKSDRISIEDASNLIADLSVMLEGFGVKLSIESDLGPEAFRDFIGQFPASKVGVNYDIGNSAALGYSWRDEFDAYWDRINLIHIKDRTRAGGSVRLGTGDAEVVEIMRHVIGHDFQGPITLQMFRDAEGVHEFDTQIDWLLRSLAEGEA